MKFHTRSTEGILYYLGEIVRRNLAPEHAATRVIIRTKVGTELRDISDATIAPAPKRSPMSCRSAIFRDTASMRGIPCSCENIFVVNEGPSVGNNVISVSYNGVMYSVPHDRETGGRSSQVIELVKQVLNLNTSAKQLPSTTVISVVGAQ